MQNINLFACFKFTYYIILIGTFDVSVALQSREKRRDTIKKRTFIIKVLKLIAIILLLSTLLVLAIKK